MDLTSLRYACLKSIAWNILRHNFRYKILHRNTEPPMEYVFLQKHYSDQLITIISELLKPEACCQKPKDEFYSYLSNGRRLTFSVKECINFVCNSHLESFCARYFHDAALFEHVLPTVILNCPNLREINLSHRYLPQEVQLIFQSLPELRNVDLKCTNVNDEDLMNICRFCPKLEYLNLKFTNVSDFGIFFICNKITSFEHCDEDKIPTRDIKYLYLTDSFTTSEGLKCALDNLPNLQILAGNQNYSISHNDVTTAMVKILKASDVHRVFKLKKAYFNDLVHSLDDMKLCVDACPEVETLTLKFFNEESKKFFFLSEFPRVKQIILHTYLPLINSEDFLEFLRKKGNQLESLSIHFSWQMLQEAMYTDVLNTCKDARHLFYSVEKDNKFQKPNDKILMENNERKVNFFEITINPICRRCVYNEGYDTKAICSRNTNI